MNWTRVLLGVDVVEIIALLSELVLGGSVFELLGEEGVVLLHDLPGQRTMNLRRHCCTDSASLSLVLLDLGLG